MQENAITLSIIIVNWNAKKYLGICLNSLYKETESSFEVIVVDNNSEDGSQQMVKEKFPRIILIENKDNPGFSKANNQALKQSKGKYVLFLNPDTKVENRAIDKSLNFLKDHSEIGLVGVRLTTEGGETQLSAARKLPSIWGEFVGFFLRNPLPKTKLFGNYLMSYWDHKDRREVEAISGAYILGRSKVIKKLKGFDESFFLYGEDVDLCARVRKLGLKNYYLGDISMTHYGAKSSSYSPESILRSSTAGVAALYLFFAKNKSKTYANLYKIIMRSFSFFEFVLRSLSLCFFSKNKEVLRAKTSVYKKIFLWSLKWQE